MSQGFDLYSKALDATKAIKSIKQHKAKEDNIKRAEKALAQNLHSNPEMVRVLSRPVLSDIYKCIDNEQVKGTIEIELFRRDHDPDNVCGYDNLPLYGYMDQSDFFDIYGLGF